MPDGRTDTLQTKQHDDEIAAPLYLAVIYHVLLVGSDDRARFRVELLGIDGDASILGRLRGRGESFILLNTEFL